MSQIAVGIREVGFELQSRSVAVNSLRDASAVLVDGRQVAVSVGEGWVDLNRSRVALHSALRKRKHSK